MRIALLIFCLTALFACTKHEPSDFEIEGMTQDAVSEKLGKPPDLAIVTGKQLNGSMGPKPKLAASMSDNDTIVMWQYDVTDSRAAMVFFDDAGFVAEVVIFPTDVMY